MYSFKVIFPILPFLILQCSIYRSYITTEYSPLPRSPRYRNSLQQQSGNETVHSANNQRPTLTFFSTATCYEPILSKCFSTAVEYQTLVWCAFPRNVQIQIEVSITNEAIALFRNEDIHVTVRNQFIRCGVSLHFSQPLGVILHC